MNKLLIAYAALAFGATAYAQEASPSDQPATSPPSRLQSTQSGPDMTGQSIYDTDGHAIGIVDTMTNDTSGQRMAVVSVDRRLGLGARRVLFPTNSLQAREKGGYMTSLSEGQIEQLPKANATNTPAP
jgi:hypothetical protein